MPHERVTGKGRGREVMTAVKLLYYWVWFFLLSSKVETLASVLVFRKCLGGSEAVPMQLRRGEGLVAWYGFTSHLGLTLKQNCTYLSSRQGHNRLWRLTVWGFFSPSSSCWKWCRGCAALHPLGCAMKAPGNASLRPGPELQLRASKAEAYEK